MHLPDSNLAEASGEGELRHLSCRIRPSHRPIQPPYVLRGSIVGQRASCRAGSLVEHEPNCSGSQLSHAVAGILERSAIAVWRRGVGLESSRRKQKPAGMDESDESESASTSNKGQYFFVWYKRKLETTGDATHTKDRAREKEDLYLVIHDSFFFY
ncbi:hypothetical protein SETIT_5G140200v2 [Setaria italica]|uniref:Uncharacterized protein n=2 Tax=Setaria italica TaxID=4555 RepID=A0A368R4P7_SETIT|nr:uncharacterized protein LOC101771503 isoform X1 [Setaria italica]RCV25112.1 hypothetical protein SETIT_5G140200v2 [Setaria italica]